MTDSALERELDRSRREANPAIETLRLSIDETYEKYRRNSEETERLRRRLFDLNTLKRQLEREVVCPICIDNNTY